MKVGDLVKNKHSPKLYNAGLIIKSTNEKWFFIWWRNGSFSNHSKEVLEVISEND